MIELEGVDFAYRPGQPILRGLDLVVPAGLTLVVGPNGSGKSTLLRLMGGIEPPDAGSVRVDGHDLWREEVEARRRLAYVPESPDITPHASLRELVSLVARLRGVDPAHGIGLLQRLGLGPHSRDSVQQLSQGQRRRALLAAAMVGAPGHLLLDEPLETLDREGRDLVLEWIDRRLEAGAAVVVVSHLVEPFVARAVQAVGLAAGGSCTTVGTAETPPTRAAVEGLARGQL